MCVYREGWGAGWHKGREWDGIKAGSGLHLFYSDLVYIMTGMVSMDKNVEDVGRRSKNPPPPEGGWEDTVPYILAPKGSVKIGHGIRANGKTF